MTSPDSPSHPVAWLIRGRIKPTYKDSEKWVKSWSENGLGQKTVFRARSGQNRLVFLTKQTIEGIFEPFTNQ
jgi:hypothetical protein